MRNNKNPFSNEKGFKIYLKTPKEVVINEMINISKVYSEIQGFNASKFDNAILDKIAKGNFKDE